MTEVKPRLQYDRARDLKDAFIRKVLQATHEDMNLQRSGVRDAINAVADKAVALLGDKEVVALTHDWAMKDQVFSGTLVVFTEDFLLDASIHVSRDGFENSVIMRSRRSLESVSVRSVDRIQSYSDYEEWPNSTLLDLKYEWGAMSLPLGKVPTDKAKEDVARLLPELANDLIQKAG